MGRCLPTANQRLIVVAAHPDDEVVGAGALLANQRDAFVFHVTDGAPLNPRFWPTGMKREEYARVRALEAERALAIAGITSTQICHLGVVDGEAHSCLPALSIKLAIMFSLLAPDVVITHAYEGGHHDHDSTSFAVHAARQLLLRSGRAWPIVSEMTSYHAFRGQFTTAEFLPYPGLEPETDLILSEDEKRCKRSMLACFETQAPIVAKFGVEFERFRRAPKYVFTRPPHSGPLHYEQLLRQVDAGERWRLRAFDALTELGLNSTDPL